MLTHEELKITCLQLAHNTNVQDKLTGVVSTLSADDVVSRAKAYFDFVSIYQKARQEEKPSR